MSSVSASLHIPECINTMEIIEKNLSNIEKKIQTSTAEDLGEMLKELNKHEDDIDKFIKIIGLITLKKLKLDRDLKTKAKKLPERLPQLKEQINEFKNLVTTNLLYRLAQNNNSQSTDLSFTSVASTTPSTPRKRSVTSEHIEIMSP